MRTEPEQKVALVIAGAAEYSESLAVAFAERGMDVAIVFFHEPTAPAEKIKARVERQGRTCLLIYPDADNRLTSRAFARQAVERIVQELGGLDVFVNLANLSGQEPAPDLFAPDACNSLSSLSRLLPDVAIVKAALNHIVDEPA
jgi:NAD(P)-dependent dehydrogenase (short-subunit alcohol dehydrogenase family)